MVVLGVLVHAIAKSSVGRDQRSVQPEVTVKQIGDALDEQFVLPLEVVGLLLTAALIGAVIIAMKEEGKNEAPTSTSNIEMFQTQAPVARMVRIVVLNRVSELELELGGCI